MRQCLSRALFIAEVELNCACPITIRRNLSPNFRRSKMRVCLLILLLALPFTGSPGANSGRTPTQAQGQLGSAKSEVEKLIPPSNTQLVGVPVSTINPKHTL